MGTVTEWPGEITAPLPPFLRAQTQPDSVEDYEQNNDDEDAFDEENGSFVVYGGPNEDDEFRMLNIVNCMKSGNASADEDYSGGEEVKMNTRMNSLVPAHSDLDGPGRGLPSGVQRPRAAASPGNARHVRVTTPTSEPPRGNAVVQLKQLFETMQEGNGSAETSHPRAEDSVHKSAEFSTNSDSAPASEHNSLLEQPEAEENSLLEKSASEQPEAEENSLLEKSASEQPEAEENSLLEKSASEQPEAEENSLLEKSTSANEENSLVENSVQEFSTHKFPAQREPSQSGSHDNETQSTSAPSGPARPSPQFRPASVRMLQPEYSTIERTMLNEFALSLVESPSDSVSPGSSTKGASGKLTLNGMGTPPGTLRRRLRQPTPMAGDPHSGSDTEIEEEDPKAQTPKSTSPAKDASAPRHVPSTPPRTVSGPATTSISKNPVENHMAKGAHLMEMMKARYKSQEANSTSMDTTSDDESSSSAGEGTPRTAGMQTWPSSNHGTPRVDRNLRVPDELRFQNFSPQRQSPLTPINIQLSDDMFDSADLSSVMNEQPPVPVSQDGTDVDDSMLSDRLLLPRDANVSPRNRRAEAIERKYPRARTSTPSLEADAARDRLTAAAQKRPEPPNLGQWREFDDNASSDQHVSSPRLRFIAPGHPAHTSLDRPHSMEFDPARNSWMNTSSRRTDLDVSDSFDISSTDMHSQDEHADRDSFVQHDAFPYGSDNAVNRNEETRPEHPAPRPILKQPSSEFAAKRTLPRMVSFTDVPQKRVVPSRAPHSEPNVMPQAAANENNASPAADPGMTRTQQPIFTQDDQETLLQQPPMLSLDVPMLPSASAGPVPQSVHPKPLSPTYSSYSQVPPQGYVYPPFSYDSANMQMFPSISSKGLAYTSGARSTPDSPRTSIAAYVSRPDSQLSVGARREISPELLRTLERLVPRSQWPTLASLALGGTSLMSIEGLSELTPLLQELDISGNGLRSVPGFDYTLRSLVAARNPLAPSLDLPFNLTTLDISSCCISSLQALSRMRALATLIADDNSIDAFDGIADLPLVTLSLRGNRLKEVDFAHVRWTKLKKLNLGHNAIDRIDNIHHLSSLVNLNMQSNHVVTFAAAQPLSKLRCLHLSDNPLLSELDAANFPKLRVLNLDNTSIGAIPNLTSHLHTLSIAKTSRGATTRFYKHEAPNTILTPLQPVHNALNFVVPRNIARLNLAGNPTLPNLLREPLYSLTHLDLTQCDLPELPPKLGTFMPNLRVLRADYNSITSIAPLTGLNRVHTLSVAMSNISHFDDLCRTLSTLTSLRTFDARMTPLTWRFYSRSPTAPVGDAFIEQDTRFCQTLSQRDWVRRIAYRHVLIKILPFLKFIDGLPCQTEREDSADVYAEFERAGIVPSAVAAV